MRSISSALRDRLMGPAGLRFMAHLGYFQAASAEMTELATGHVALFDGDLPNRHVPPYPKPMQMSRDENGARPPGRIRDNFIEMPDYANARPLTVTESNMLLAPNGVAWKGRTARPEYSTGRIVRAAHLMPMPKRAEAVRIPEGTLIQCQHASTCGDNLSEQIKGIALCRKRGVPVPEPVVLPAAYASKGYVRPQLDRLGVRYIFAEQPVLIERATIILKQHYSVTWSPEEIEAWRAANETWPAPPQQNSIIYLSRLGVKSELHTDRDYGSEQTGRIVEALGGTVVETAKTDFDGFTLLAPQADIVIADHGSALFNMLQWRTRAVIEIVSDDWWDPNFTFFGVAMGVEDHVTIRGDGLSEAQMREKLSYYVNRLRR